MKRSSPSRFNSAAAAPYAGENQYQKSVTGVRSVTSNEGSCRELERVELALVLEDGHEVSRQLIERQQEAWRHIMRVSPEVVKRLTDPAVQ